MREVRHSRRLASLFRRPSPPHRKETEVSKAIQSPIVESSTTKPKRRKAVPKSKLVKLVKAAEKLAAIRETDEDRSSTAVSTSSSTTSVTRVFSELTVDSAEISQSSSKEGGEGYCGLEPRRPTWTMVDIFEPVAVLPTVDMEEEGEALKYFWDVVRPRLTRRTFADECAVGINDAGTTSRRSAYQRDKIYPLVREVRVGNTLPNAQERRETSRTRVER